MNEPKKQWSTAQRRPTELSRTPPGQDGLAAAETDSVPDEIAANMRANRQMRQTYAGKAYGLAAACLIAWIALLCAYGAIKVTLGVETWSDQVLIAVTTGVTVSVLAAFLGVIRGLFPGKGKEDDKDDAKA